MSQAARPPEAGEFGLAWPGEPTGLAGLAFWLQAGPGTTLATGVGSTERYKARRRQDIVGGHVSTSTIYESGLTSVQDHYSTTSMGDKGRGV